jgi:hypothetical protein
MLVSLIRFGEDEVPPLKFNTLFGNPALKEYVGSVLAKELEPLKSKNSEILGEKKKLQDSLKRFESGLQEEEDKNAFKAGKLDLDTLFDKRLAARYKDWQDKISARDTELARCLEKSGAIQWGAKPVW